MIVDMHLTMAPALQQRRAMGDDATLMCPSVAILSSWSDLDWDQADGLQLETQEEFERIVVRTCNSVYEMIVECGSTGDVLVRGGSFFPSFSKAQLAGSSFGGSFLKQRGIYVGLRMELFHDGRRIVTSPVKSIGVEPLAASRRLVS
jgi:hypothetical protein